MVIARKVKFIKYSKINLKENKEIKNSRADKNYFETEINNTFEEAIMCKQPTTEPGRIQRQEGTTKQIRLYAKNNDIKDLQ